MRNDKYLSSEQGITGKIWWDQVQVKCCALYIPMNGCGKHDIDRSVHHKNSNIDGIHSI